MLREIAPVFGHEGTFFRLPTSDDAEAIRRIRNDQTTWENLTDPTPITESDQVAWYRALSSRAGTRCFVVFDEVNPFLGYVRMDEYDKINRSVRVGLDIAPEFRGRGHGQKAFSLLLRYAFHEMNVHRVWLLVLHTNLRAIHVYQKIGFSPEGALREAVFRHGRYVDYKIMSILDKEYSG